MASILDYCVLLHWVIRVADNLLSLPPGLIHVGLAPGLTHVSLAPGLIHVGLPPGLVHVSLPLTLASHVPCWLCPTDRSPEGIYEGS